MGKKQLMAIIQYSPTDAIPNEVRTLVEAAKKASEAAYAPYSSFKVGAALLDNSGNIIMGSNQENASYPLCMCAERVALYTHSALDQKTQITKLAVFANSTQKLSTSPPSPCGACRQVIAEYAKRQTSNIEIIMTNQFGYVWIFESIEVLLPHAFNPENLLGD